MIPIERNSVARVPGFLAACVILAGCGAEGQNASYFRDAAGTPVAVTHAPVDESIGVPAFLESPNTVTNASSPAVGAFGTTTVQQPVFETGGRPALSPERQLASAASQLLAQAPVEPQHPGRQDRPAEAEVPPADQGLKAAGQDGGKPAAPDRRPVPLSRRIIYTASLTLVVNDFTAAEEAITRLVEAAGGYVSKVDISRRTGTNRYGTWTLRIPVAEYNAFLGQLDGLGVPENRQQQAQDVTQQFIDLDARISNQQRLEARLLKLLEDREGELKEVIEVERELARVRSEVEQMQGQLRYLQSQVAFTTITISVREEQDYKPPQAPTFRSRIASSWGMSLATLSDFGQGAAIFLVAASPWLAVLLPLLLLVRWLWRRSRAAPA